MKDISDEQFDEVISRAISELPQKYIKGLDNVAIVQADEPDEQQRRELKLRCNHELLGLYQGIPLTKRGSNYNLVIPDKITLFKGALLAHSKDLADFRRHVKHTLWHEIAHFYGLDHDRIHGLENKPKNTKL
jgi:predicted Zn-dependent protease with MMP-like domain